MVVSSFTHSMTCLVFRINNFYKPSYSLTLESRPLIYNADFKLVFHCNNAPRLIARRIFRYSDFVAMQGALYVISIWGHVEDCRRSFYLLKMMSRENQPRRRASSNTERSSSIAASGWPPSCSIRFTTMTVVLL